MFASIHSVIRNYFTEQVEASDSDFGLVAHDNVGTVDDPSAGRYVRVSVAGGESRPITCGPLVRYRESGRVLVELYEPLHRGDGEQLDLADEIAGWFRGHKITSDDGVSVTLDAPSIGQGTRAGAYWLRIVSINYRADALIQVA